MKTFSQATDLPTALRAANAWTMIRDEAGNALVVDLVGGIVDDATGIIRANPGVFEPIAASDGTVHLIVDDRRVDPLAAMTSANGGAL
jgi:hypothetical protein